MRLNFTNRQAERVLYIALQPSLTQILIKKFSSHFLFSIIKITFSLYLLVILFCTMGLVLTSVLNTRGFSLKDSVINLFVRKLKCLYFDHYTDYNYGHHNADDYFRPGFYDPYDNQQSNTIGCYYPWKKARRKYYI